MRFAAVSQQDSAAAQVPESSENLSLWSPWYGPLYTLGQPGCEHEAANAPMEPPPLPVPAVSLLQPDSGTSGARPWSLRVEVKVPPPLERFVVLPQRLLQAGL